MNYLDKYKGFTYYTTLLVYLDERKEKVKENVIEREKMGPVINNETLIEKPIEKEENNGRRKYLLRKQHNS